jgi:hypothetical protein
MSRPHVGNLKRDFFIFALYDSGEYAPKAVARLMRERGYITVTVKIVRDAVKRRERYPEFYVNHFGQFVSPQDVELKQ